MKIVPTTSLRETIVPFLVLLAFWNLLTPDFTVASLAIGTVVCAGTVLFSEDLLFRRGEVPLYSIGTIPVYMRLILRLVVEVIKSNIDVARTVLSPRLRIQPQFVTLPVSYRTEFNRVVQAQCITLTPGTISVEVKETEILVHALTDRAAEQLLHNFAVPALLRTEKGYQE